MTVISIKRNLAIASGVAVLLLAPLGCDYFSKKAPPDDMVNVKRDAENLGLPDDIVNVKVDAEKVGLPEEFQNRLAGSGVKGLILVSEGEIRAIKLDGTPIELCGSGSETDKSTQSSCKVATTANALVRYISDPLSPSGPGYCSTGLSGRSDCHKDTRKWPYHVDDTGKLHHNCFSACT